MSRVFISYSIEEGKKVNAAADLTRTKLKAAGIDVWLDKYSIRAGYDWRNEIDEGIMNRDVLIVLLDKISAKSAYVTYEWAFALGNRKHVIALKIEDCDIHSRLNLETV